MDRDEALRLLDKGVEGVAQWNHHKSTGKPIPSISNSKFSGDLKKVDFSGVDLQDVDFSDADLSRADLSNTDLRRARLIDCVLDGAILNGARFGGTIIACDLSKVEGLEETRHGSSSHVSFDTILLFGKSIPEKFLLSACRGAEMAIRLLEPSARLDKSESGRDYDPRRGSVPDMKFYIAGAQDVSTTKIYGGKFDQCIFGDHNSINNYTRAIDKMAIPEPDITQALKDARKKVDEQNEISKKDKVDLVEQLKALAAELETSERDPGRLRRFWERIKEVSPTVASILSSAASIAKLL